MVRRQYRGKLLFPGRSNLVSHQARRTRPQSLPTMPRRRPNSTGLVSFQILLDAPFVAPLELITLWGWNEDGKISCMRSWLLVSGLFPGGSAVRGLVGHTVGQVPDGA